MTEFLQIQRAGPQMAAAQQPDAARKAAAQLEATFLAEMLKSAGLGEQDNSFSGSAGEDQFASFQRQALAEAMVQKGGIGLAEVFYRAILESGYEK